jgi:hypothetical protein
LDVEWNSYTFNLWIDGVRRAVDMPFYWGSLTEWVSAIDIYNNGSLGASGPTTDYPLQITSLHG